MVDAEAALPGFGGSLSDMFPCWRVFAMSHIARRQLLTTPFAVLLAVVATAALGSLHSALADDAPSVDESPLFRDPPTDARGKYAKGKGVKLHDHGFNSQASRLIELPKTAFSDGRRYQLSDFAGKILVVVYFEPGAPNWLPKLKDEVAWLAKVSDKPVAVLGIAAGSTATVRAALHGWDPGFPVFCDNLRVYESLYYFEAPPCIALIVGPNGKRHHPAISKPPGYMFGDWGATLDDVNKLLPDAAWKYKDGGYDKRLAPIIDLLEWNRYEEGVSKLKSLRKDGSKTAAESAEKLFAAVLAEGETWNANAEKLAAESPSKAYDLYVRIATVFAGEPLAAKAEAPLKALKANPAVIDELRARDMVSKVMEFVSTATATPKNQQRISDALLEIITKYGKTPAGEYAETVESLWGQIGPWGT
jgi:hypothetical protein